ncbi:MAG: HAD family hydrolase [Thermomicrobiales bacterium]
MTERDVPVLILLDWYRTLSHSLFWEPWTESDDVILRDVAGRMATALFGGDWRALHRRWMYGEVAAEAVVDAVARAAGVDPALAMRGLIGSCEGMVPASPDILPRVEWLRAHGIRVGIATDNMDTFTRWTVPALDLGRWFEPILNSADLGALKGDALDAAGHSPFFGTLLGELASDTLVYLVDDSAPTAPVAEAAGITFCHVTPERDAAAWLDALARELLPEASASVSRATVARRSGGRRA